LTPDVGDAVICVHPAGIPNADPVFTDEAIDPRAALMYTTMVPADGTVIDGIAQCPAE
jgi:hypothetical protein